MCRLCLVCRSAFRIAHRRQDNLAVIVIGNHGVLSLATQGATSRNCANPAVAIGHETEMALEQETLLRQRPAHRQIRPAHIMSWTVKIALTFRCPVSNCKASSGESFSSLLTK